MEEKPKEGSALPFSTILVAMAVIGGMWFYVKPLKGTRPAVDTNACCDEKIQARLWEDPFSTVKKHKKDTNATYRSISNTQIPGKIAEKISDNCKVTVLGISMFGSPYAEDAEGRLRKRYAAVSALNRLGYAPEDSQHIDYFESELVQSDDTYSGSEVMYRYIKRKQNHTLTVPFEWFSQIKNDDVDAPSIALLLWLNDDKFQSKPLKKLSYLIGEIKNGVLEEIKKTPENDLTSIENIEFKIMGPAGSTNLVAMMEEVSGQNYECETCKVGTECRCYSNVQIYSPFATADRQLLFKEVLANKEVYEQYKDDNVSSYINSKSGGKIKLIRTIRSDKDLCDSLIKELELRKIDPAKDLKHHVALISEWDTFYGRSLPKAFIKSLIEPDNGTTRPELEKQLHRFSYLRGIDGQLPGELQLKLDRRTEGEEAKTEKELNAKSFMHRPVGRSQFDYLLRLTHQISQLKSDLIKKGERLKAIGVLGSDVYDKLLILQAMRRHFPEVIFFTTDLDARLLHPDEFKWSRNLIVASNFGLKLHEYIQGAIPAFRDNYQTSLFFSTILALKASDKVFIKDASPQQYCILQTLQPRMFEIGRGGAFDLTDNIQNNGNKISISLEIDGQKRDIKLEPSTLYPESDLAAVFDSLDNIKGKYTYRVGIILVLIIVLIYVSNDNAKKRFSGFIADKSILTMRILLLFFIIYFADIAYSACESSFTKEPFSVFSGISIWPTEILRLLSGILSICFLFYVWGEIRSTDEGVTKKYGLYESGGGSVKHSIIAQMFPYYWKIDDSEDKKCAACFGNLWKEYLSLGSFDKRIRRSVIYTIVFMLFGVFIIRTLESFGYGLFVPARGDFSFCVDFVVLKCISVPCMLLLTFFIVDHHKLFRRLIELSAEEEKVCLPKVGIKYREHAYQKTLLLADYTERTKWLDLFSFIVLFLMIVARSRYFDNWNMSIGLLIVFVTLGMFSFACSIVLHKEIKRYKNGIVAELRDEIICLHTKSLKVHDGVYENVDFEMEQIRYTIDSIESIRKGAFRPLIQHPLFQTALLPFGSAGSLLILNFFT